MYTKGNRRGGHFVAKLNWGCPLILITKSAADPLPAKHQSSFLPFRFPAAVPTALPLFSPFENRGFRLGNITLPGSALVSA